MMRKQPNTMTLAAEQEVSKRAEFAIKHGAWDIVKAHVQDLVFGPEWLTYYHDKSYTASNRRKGVHLKIDLDGRVSLDRKLKCGTYRSNSIKHPDLRTAATEFRKAAQRWAAQ